MSRENYAKALNTIKIRIEQAIGRAVKGTKGALEKEASDTLDFARNFAPKDTGTLEKSIYMEDLSKEHSTIGKYEIRVNYRNKYPNEHVRKDGKVVHYPKNGGPEKRVGSYAWEVHEYVQPKGTWTSHSPDPERGGGYFERAFAIAKQVAIPNIVNAVKGAIAGNLNVGMIYTRRNGGGR